MKKIFQPWLNNVSLNRNIIRRSLEYGYLPDDWNKQRKEIGCNIVILDEGSYYIYLALETDVVEIDGSYYHKNSEYIFYDVINNNYNLNQRSCEIMLPNGAWAKTVYRKTALLNNRTRIAIPLMYEYIGLGVTPDHIVWDDGNRPSQLILHKNDIVTTVEGIRCWKDDAFFWDIDQKYHIEEYRLRYSSSFNDFIYKYEEECVVCKELIDVKGNYSGIKLKSPNFITFRESEGMISFQPYGKGCGWLREGRQSMKPGKFIRAFLKADFTDKELEAFSNRFKVYEKGEELKFKYVSFEEAYCQNNYYNNAEGIKSCMWDQEYTEFYPEAAKALVCYSDNQGFLGRAIVWDAREADSGEPIMVMDRIYGKDDVNRAFREYAKSQNWYRRYRDSYEDKNKWINLSDEVVSLKLFVELGYDCPTESAPYMDTFTYGAQGKLFNHQPEYKDFLIYNDTDGEVHYSDGYGYTVVTSGAMVPNEDVIYYCGETYGPNELADCCVTGETVIVANCISFVHAGERLYVSDADFIRFNEEADYFEIIDEEEEVLFTTTRLRNYEN